MYSNWKKSPCSDENNGRLCTGQEDMGGEGAHYNHKPIIQSSSEGFYRCQLNNVPVVQQGSLTDTAETASNYQ